MLFVLDVSMRVRECEVDGNAGDVWGMNMWVVQLLYLVLHLRCTQCSIMLHLNDVCFLPWICL